MEVLSILSLVTLFDTCMNLIDKVDAFKSFGIDSELLGKKIDLNKLLLKKWGEMVGIDPSRKQSTIAEEHHPRLDEEEVRIKVEEILVEIRKLFESISDVWPHSTGHNYAATTGTFANMITRNSSRPTPKVGYWKILKWALKEKASYESKIELLDGFIEDLYLLIPDETAANQTHEVVIHIKTLLEDSRKELSAQVEYEKRQRVLKYLRPDPWESKYESIKESWTAGTSVWLFERNEFLKWVDDSSKETCRTLWIHGPPGFGKTFTCAKVIEYLSVEYPGRIAYFFCTSDREEAKDPYAILRAWIYQITVQNASAFDDVHESCVGKEHRSALNSELWTLLHDLCQTQPNYFLIVDGFDECIEELGDAETRSSFLNHLFVTLQSTTAKVLIMSRDTFDIRTALRPAMPQTLQDFTLEYRISKQDVQNDIQEFSRGVFEHLLAKKSTNLMNELAMEAADKCDGMFLWIKLLRRQLSPGKSPAQLRRIVEEMPPGLDQAYRRDLIRISELDKSENARALAILRWVIFAVRPLKISELTEALITGNDSLLDEFPTDELPDPYDEDYVNEEILRLCGSLIEIRSPSNDALVPERTIHLAHFSIKEYIQSEETKNPNSGSLFSFKAEDTNHREDTHHRELLEVCLKYLCYHDFNLEFEEPIDKKIIEHDLTFYSYASEYLTHHLQMIESRDERLEKLFLQFFDPTKSYWKVWADYRFVKSQSKKDSTLKISLGNPVYYAALFGLSNVLHKLREMGCDIKNEGGGYGHALHAAAAKGHLETVNVLLSWGVGEDKIVGKYQTALIGAAAGGHAMVVDRLLNTSIPLNTMDKAGRSAIFYACDRGDANIVQMLLSKSADPSLTGLQSMEHPIHRAASGGHGPIVRLLLDHGEIPDALDQYRTTPLFGAARNGHLNVCKLLVDNGANVKYSEHVRKITPLHLAAFGGNEDVVKFFIECGAPVNATGIEDRTPLHRAVIEGHLPIAKLLVEIGGSNVNAIDTRLETPLHYASFTGKLAFVEYLLEHGSDVNLQNIMGCTPLQLACYRRHLAVASAIISYAPDLDLHDCFGFTCLDVAALHAPTLRALEQHDCVAKHKQEREKSARSYTIHTLLKSCKAIMGGDGTLYSIVARCLLLLGDETDAAAGFELEIKVLESGEYEHRSVCDGVDGGHEARIIRGNRFRCKVCPDTDLCEKCFNSHATGGLGELCKGHGFLKLPRDGQSLPRRGYVDAEGITTLGKWLRGLIDRYSE